MSLSTLTLVTTEKNSHLNIHSILIFSLFIFFIIIPYFWLPVALRFACSDAAVWILILSSLSSHTEMFVEQNAVRLNFRILIKSHILSHHTLCVEIMKSFLQVLLENIVINARYLQSSTHNLQGVLQRDFNGYLNTLNLHCV